MSISLPKPIAAYFAADQAGDAAQLARCFVSDAPPTVDELYWAAAKNHELESAYYAERLAERSKRTDADRARRETVAEAFLADKGQRAIAHPPPSCKQCYIVTEPAAYRCTRAMALSSCRPSFVNPVAWLRPLSARSTCRCVAVTP
jgi:hypothetical protein